MKIENVIIRQEEERDRRRVEELHRRAFWNQYAPGCDEHYLAHILRAHGDFVPELDLVAEADGVPVGNIMYTLSALEDEQGCTRRILTFGPVGVEPEYQRRGISRLLIERSFDIAREMNFGAVVIFGNPGNYVSRGFVSCKRHNICVEGGVFPMAMLVKELMPGFFDGRRYIFRESPAYEVDEDEAEAFDRGFEPMEKAVRPSQEEFYIHSHSVLR